MIRRKYKMGSTITNITTLPSPERFGLTAFLDLLPRREPLPAQNSRNLEEFRFQLLRSLAPGTAYECLMADSLVALEWELLQHRRMRDRCISNEIRERIAEAYVTWRSERHEDDLDAEYDAWIRAGKTHESYVNRPFDRKAMRLEGEALALRAVDPDPEIVMEAENEIAALGMDLLSILAEVMAGSHTTATYHNLKIPVLEKRRREVMKDFEDLQSLRPIEAMKVID
jgi:hypothetical protein